MQASLSEIIYCSRATASSGDPGQGGIREILVVADHKNGRAGITGALLLRAGCFAQVLEGPTEAVEHTFATIRADPRHHGLVVLANRATTRRAFPDWAMGFVTARDEPAADAMLARALATAGTALADEVLEMLRNSVESTAIWGTPVPAAAI